MSPPDTDKETQKRRHRPVLLLLIAAVALAVIIYISYGVSPYSVEPGEDATPATEGEAAGTATDG